MQQIMHVWQMRFVTSINRKIPIFMDLYFAICINKRHKRRIKRHSKNNDIKI